MAAAAAAAVASEGILIGDKVYSGVLITLDNCLIPEEKCALTPSVLDGLDLETETDLRCVGCELIQSAGILLRLPQEKCVIVSCTEDAAHCKSVPSRVPITSAEFILSGILRQEADPAKYLLNSTGGNSVPTPAKRRR